MKSVKLEEKNRNLGQLFVISVIFGIIAISIIILIYLFLKPKYHKRKVKKELNYPNSFKCLDSHIVRSKGELIIDNYLYLSGLKHQYEKKIKTNFGPIKPDWYLPKHNIYIEYWGFSGKKYESRKRQKLKLYKKAKMRVISIENSMFSDIYKNLDKLLNRVNKEKEESNFYLQKKYCPGCGLILDERF